MYNTRSMKMIKKMKFKEKNGFTLIELLVVMAIIAVLTTISLASFRNVQIKARDGQRKSDLGQLQRALELYFNDYGSYPPSDSGEITGFNWKTLDTAGSEFKDVNGTVYMKELVGDPRANPTNYCYVSGGTYYVIYARLENINDPKISSYTCNGETYNYEASGPNPEPTP